MPYRAPNAYARFVRTAGPVNAPGATRVMGLIGTGLNYYEVYNEPIQKTSDKPYEALTNPNVFEILNVSTKPVFFGKKTVDNVVYKQGVNFDLKDGKNIAWSILEDSTATATVTDMGTDGSIAFKAVITALVDANNQHYVQDGEWKIEVTYVDSENGAYRVINTLTQEIIGEYGVDSADKYNVIPGVKLTVTTTNGTAVGDYVLVKTTAGKTEKDATVGFDVTVVNYSASLQANVKSLMIVNDNAIKTGSYDIAVTDVATKEITITETATSTVLHTGVIGSLAEYLEVIPGVTFILDELPALASVGDTVRIKTVAKTVGLAPAEGSVYYVSYKYRKADEDYGAQVFFDYDDIVAEYGNYDVTASGVVINSLSLGAEIAFQNGVTRIVCVQAKNDSDYEMTKAIDALKRALPGVTNVNSIVPLTKSAVVGAHAMNHVNLMSDPENGKERMVYLGAAPNQLLTKNPTALDKSIGIVETARSYNNERVVFVAPGEAVKQVRDLTTGRVNDRKLPACYLAVAVAALGLVHDPAEPLTNKTITGFKELISLYMESEKNFLAEAGCLVLEQKGSVIKVRHGITTSTADVNSSEVTLIQIKDYVIEAVRTSTAELYVGNKNRPSIITDVQYTISSILNQFISQQVIIGFSGLSVKRSKDDPRQIDVRFEIEAVYPLNYISISFGFSAVS